MADELSFSPSSSASNNFTNFRPITCIILHDLSFICSFIISYPLYFSYFIFFSPYIIKLISFISPLFIATVIISLLLTTTTALCPNMPQLKLGILQTVIQELKSNLDGDHGDATDFNFEELEIYKIVFDRTLSITICNEGDEETPSTKKILEDSVRDCTISDSGVDNLEEEKGLEKLFEELDRFEDFTTANEINSDSDEVIEELRKAEETPVKKDNIGGGSEAESVAISLSDDDKFSKNSVRSSSWRSNSSSMLSSHGSMREEKEWRRTLACKLFEERHNSRGGEEGMDSLWEAYENDNSKNRKETMINNSKSKTVMILEKKNSNNGGFLSFNDDEDEDDDDDVEMSNGHLCCLQALKLSTSKMNLGMRKPNLVKISKALKGFGWLHHVKNKHGKKS